MGFCAVPKEALRRAAEVDCQWPRGYEPTWKIESVPNGFTTETFKLACEMAWSIWEDAYNVKTHFVETGFANWPIRSIRIDGPGGVLARQFLPCGNVGSNSVLRMEVDVSESYVNATNPSDRMIDLVETIGHEAGHFWGLGHVESPPRDIMNPFIQRPSMRAPGPWSGPEMSKRYGAVDEEPLPPTALPAPSDLDLTFNTTTNRVSLTWDDNSSGEDGFQIHRNGNIVGTVPRGNTRWAEVVSTGTYEYRIRAFLGDQVSGFSNSQVIIVESPSDDNDDTEEPMEIEFSGKLILDPQKFRVW
jgi:hypothetical protein